MPIDSGFFNSMGGDRKYNAVQMSEIFEGVLNDGVFPSVGEFLATTPGEGLQVLVGTGRAWFNGTWTRNKAKYPVDISQPDPVFERLDTVALVVNKSVSVRLNSIQIFNGPIGVTPSAPVLTDTDEVFYHPLANIHVKPNATKINASDIDILVGTATTPFTTSILQQTNISALFSNWNDQFMTWWNGIKEVLTDDVLGNILVQLDEKVNVSDKATLAEAKAGSNDAKWMTPYTTKNSTDPLARLPIGSIVTSLSPLEANYNSNPKYISISAVGGRSTPTSLKNYYFPRHPTSVTKSQNQKFNNIAPIYQVVTKNSTEWFYVLVGQTAYDAYNVNIYQGVIDPSTNTVTHKIVRSGGSMTGTRPVDPNSFSPGYIFKSDVNSSVLEIIYQQGTPGGQYTWIRGSTNTIPFSSSSIILSAALPTSEFGYIPSLVAHGAWNGCQFIVLYSAGVSSSYSGYSYISYLKLNSAGTAIETKSVWSSYDHPSNGESVVSYLHNVPNGSNNLSPSVTLSTGNIAFLTTKSGNLYLNKVTTAPNLTQITVGSGMYNPELIGYQGSYAYILFSKSSSVCVGSVSMTSGSLSYKELAATDSYGSSLSATSAVIKNTYCYISSNYKLKSNYIIQKQEGINVYFTQFDVNGNLRTPSAWDMCGTIKPAPFFTNLPSSIRTYHFVNGSFSVCLQHGILYISVNTTGEKFKINMLANEVDNEWHIKSGMDSVRYWVMGNDIYLWTGYCSNNEYYDQHLWKLDLSTIYTDLPNAFIRIS